MKLKSCPKVAYGKCVRPEDTVKRLETSLGQVYEYEYVEEQVSDYLYWGSLFFDELEFPAMGKGISSILCRASTMAEGAEWLSLGKRRSLKGHVNCHQNDIRNPLRIEDLISHVSTATPSVLEKIKRTEFAQHWVDGYSLRTEAELKVPLEYVHAISGTNGLAAGNCAEEALAHAVNEIFERRACITVLKHRMVVPTIDIESIGNEVIRSQIDFIRSRNIEVYIKDLSFGGALPCIAAYFINRNISGDMQSHHLFKVASSFDREEALTRCFTEYAQGQKKNIPDAPLEHDYQRLLCLGNDTDYFLSVFWLGYVPYTNAEFLKEGDLIPFDKGQVYSDCLDDLNAAMDICAQIGKDLVVVDLTDPAVGFPVFQAIIPGYSDILPYHPRTSRVLFTGWTREMPLGYYLDKNGQKKALTPSTQGNKLLVNSLEK